MKRHAIVTSAMVFLGIATLAGCATHKSPNTFHRNEVGRMQTVEAGTVTAVREVSIHTDGSVGATATGAVVGGVAGSTIGGGRGQTLATAGGAAAGAARPALPPAHRARPAAAARLGHRRPAGTGFDPFRLPPSGMKTTAM